MEVSAVSGQSASMATNGTGSTGVDKQAFLQLLVAQLKNQDPLKPVESQEFIAQLAQLQTLEQLGTLTDTMQVALEMETMNQSLSLLGRQVEYQTSSGDTTETGVVQGVRVTGGLPMLVVDGQEVAPGNVISVKTS